MYKCIAHYIAKVVTVEGKKEVHVCANKANHEGVVICIYNRYMSTASGDDTVTWMRSCTAC